MEKVRSHSMCPANFRMKGIFENNWKFDLLEIQMRCRESENFGKVMRLTNGTLEFCSIE